MDKDKVKEYLSIINGNIDNIDESLIDFCIDEVVDRILLYLNTDELSSRLERIIAKIVNTGLAKALKDYELSTEDNLATDKAISSISDNGQSISYSNEITRYFSSATDEELFTGFTSLLNRYRRPKVVYPTVNEESNS